MLSKETHLWLIVVLLIQGKVSAQCNGGASLDKTSNCILYENLNLKTFNGAVLSGDSKCGYTLVTANSNGLNLEVNLLQDTSTLQVKYGSHTYDLKVSGSLDLTVDGKTENVPHFSNGVTITKPGSMVLVEIKEIGIKIRFDGKTTELIQHNEIQQTLTGLCGNNGGCKDSLVMKNGKLATNTKEYYDSWSIGGCTSNNFINSCGDNPRLQNQAKVYCENLFNNEKFSKCSSYSSAFMDMCTSNYCSCKLANRNNCMCDMLDAFVKTCQAKTDELISWRNSQLCPIDCRIAEQEYMTCAPNKRQLSCGEEEIDPSKFDCEEGCYCPQGLRLFQDRCVFVDECPCVYEGRVYNTGSTIAQDCNTCTCKKGMWECTKKICTVEASCVADPHYTTFDGKRYDFMGKCMYYVVRGIGFDVICDHYVWNGAFVKNFKSSAPSYCAKVIVQIKDDVIELEQKGAVKLNGVKLDWLPYISHGFRITQASSVRTEVLIRNDVTVTWNGNSYCAVKIPTTMKGRVKGLFGTYTKTQDDDFLMPNGSIAKDPNTFGHSWKVPGSCENENTDPVENPCKNDAAKKAKAEKECAALKTNLFEGCLDNVEDNYEDCLYDACQCTLEQTDCVCEFYAEQAKRCAAKGKIIDWRKSVPGCEIKCPAGQTYQTCGNSCARSCEDIATNPNCEKTCVEGCNCPEGQTLNSNNQCVQISKCTCIWDEIRFNPDFTFIDDDQKWFAF